MTVSGFDLDLWAQTLWTALASLAWLVVMFVPLERAFPARPEQKILRRGLWTDLAFFFGQHLVFAMVAVSVLSASMPYVVGWLGTEALQGQMAELPMALQVLVVVMAGDMMAYWGHRAQHRFEWLWRFHAVHHSSVEVDWLAAHREHPLDGIYTQAMVNLPAIVLGFDIGAAMGLVAFRSLWAIFVHSNVRIPMGPLRYVVGAPQLHRWHHAKIREPGNYANLAPWVDLLFGTYHWPQGEPEAMGVDDEMPEDYVGLLWRPMVPRFSEVGDPAHDVGVVDKGVA